MKSLYTDLINILNKFQLNQLINELCEVIKYVEFS